MNFIRERMEYLKGLEQYGAGAKGNPHAGGFQVVSFAHEDRPGESYKFAPHYTFAGFGEKWHECPFRDKEEADQMAAALNSCRVTFQREAVEFSEGKERELDAARRVAIWPEATDEELTAPDLKGRLEARLPALLAGVHALLWSRLGSSGRSANGRTANQPQPKTLGSCWDGVE